MEASLRRDINFISKPRNLRLDSTKYFFKDFFIDPNKFNLDFSLHGYNKQYSNPWTPLVSHRGISNLASLGMFDVSELSLKLGSFDIKDPIMVYFTFDRNKKLLWYLS